MTIPRPRTCTSVFAVPRSMPMSRENRPKRPSNTGGDTPSRRGATFTRRITAQRVRTRGQGLGVGVAVRGTCVAVGEGRGVDAVAVPVAPVALGRGETLPLGRAVGRGVADAGRRVVAGLGVGVGAGVPGMSRASSAVERPESRIGW